ncbi:MAG: TonB-dependent receptor plug domain-containing protein, partial [Flavobacteriales bacterium]|nr:TonB-dependent receptor plug domain-containing protein [Flavobacteriales bacterium]
MSYGFSQTGLGTIKGSIIDSKSKQPIEGVKVKISLNGTVKAGAYSDEKGKFQINSISPGSYVVNMSNDNAGYKPLQLEGVIVSSESITFLDDQEISIAKSVLEISEVTVVAYKVPLIDRNGGASGATITREDIARLPVRSAAGVARTVGGISTNEGSGSISVRGSRSDGTYFYIDGIKVRGSANLPKSAIEEVKVITGGVPANYGDVTGGIISITTRGPSAKYFGSIEGVTSGFYFAGKDPFGELAETEDYTGKVFGFDKYAYNLVEGMVSGPLWMQKDSTGARTKPRLGFLLSVNLTDRLDTRPLSGGSYRIKKSVRDELLANPLRPTSTGQGTFHNALFLRSDDFESTPFRMNARNTNVSAQLKVDVNTGPSVNLSFGGSMNYVSGNNYSYSNSLLNFSNFGISKSLDYRVFGRLTQRFQNDSENSSKISSAYYSLMVDYTKERNDTYDPKHGYNIFNYGHVGTFTTTRVPSYALNPTTNAYEHDGFRDVEVAFEGSETNSSLAAITSQYYNIYAGSPEDHYENLFQIQQGNALRNGDAPGSVYNIWSNIGTPYNGFSKTENDQFRITGSGSANIGDHSLSIGFEFEKRWDRGWRNGTTTGGGGNGPIAILTIARQLT